MQTDLEPHESPDLTDGARGDPESRELELAKRAKELERTYDSKSKIIKQGNMKMMEVEEQYRREDASLLKAVTEKSKKIEHLEHKQMQLKMYIEEKQRQVKNKDDSPGSHKSLSFGKKNKVEPLRTSKKQPGTKKDKVAKDTKPTNTGSSKTGTMNRKKSLSLVSVSKEVKPTTKEHRPVLDASVKKKKGVASSKGPAQLSSLKLRPHSRSLSDPNLNSPSLDLRHTKRFSLGTGSPKLRLSSSSLVSVPESIGESNEPFQSDMNSQLYSPPPNVRSPSSSEFPWSLYERRHSGDIPRHLLSPSQHFCQEGHYQDSSVQFAITDDYSSSESSSHLDETLTRSELYKLSGTGALGLHEHHIDSRTSDSGQCCSLSQASTTLAGSGDIGVLYDSSPHISRHPMSNETNVDSSDSGKIASRNSNTRRPLTHSDSESESHGNVFLCDVDPNSSSSIDNRGLNSELTFREKLQERPANSTVIINHHIQDNLSDSAGARSDVVKNQVLHSEHICHPRDDVLEMDLSHEQLPASGECVTTVVNESSIHEQQLNLIEPIAKVQRLDDSVIASEVVKRTWKRMETTEEFTTCILPDECIPGPLSPTSNTSASDLNHEYNSLRLKSLEASDVTMTEIESSKLSLQDGGDHITMEKRLHEAKVLRCQDAAVSEMQMADLCEQIGPQNIASQTSIQDEMCEPVPDVFSERLELPTCRLDNM